MSLEYTHTRIHSHLIHEKQVCFENQFGNQVVVVRQQKYSTEDMRALHLFTYAYHHKIEAYVGSKKKTKIVKSLCVCVCVQNN